MTKRRRHGRHRRRRTDWVTIAIPAGAAILVIAVVVAVILTLRGCGGTAGAVSGRPVRRRPMLTHSRLVLTYNRLMLTHNRLVLEHNREKNGTGAASESPADETGSELETADSGETQEESAGNVHRGGRGGQHGR